MYMAGRHGHAAALTCRHPATLQGPCSVSAGCFPSAHIKAVSGLLAADALSGAPFEAMPATGHPRDQLFSQQPVPHPPIHQLEAPLRSKQDKHGS